MNVFSRCRRSRLARIAVISAFIITLLLALPALRAQETRGDILGRLVDQSGAVVPGAAVVATNLASNVQTKTTTNQTGDFLLPFLNPGSYSVSVEANGFKKYLQEGITVQVNDRITLNVKLEMGTFTEIVRVTGEPPLVNAAEASMGSVIDPKRVADLPLAHGNPTMLANLSPGVVNLLTSGWTRPFDNAAPSSFSANGSRSGTNDFTLDGAPNTTGEGGNIGFVPPTAAVEEFKIQTATFDASNGYSTGAVVNMSLKSGTNQLHGNFHEFVQNTVLNANSFFSNMAGRARDTNRLNRWGATGTGPAYIPGLYNGKNRTFWMFSYEGIKDYFPRETIVTSVPLDLQKTGDFSGLLKLGSLYQIYDPLTTTAIANGRYQRQPFPKNIIPASRIDPAATKILPFYPEPNLPGTSDGTNNWTAPNSDRDSFYSYIFRVDQNFSAKHRAFFRGNMNHRNTLGQHRFNGGYGFDQFRDNPGIGVDDVYMLSPTFLMNIRASYSRYWDAGANPTRGFDLAKYGYSQQFVSQINAADPRGLQLPHISMTGLADLSNSSTGGTYSDTYSVAATFTRIWGAHSIRFGYEQRIYHINASNFGLSSGDFTYGTNWTRGPLDNSATPPTGLGLATFLLGLPTSGFIDSNDSSAAKQSIPSFFVQDNWKVNSRLTLTVGLRYELSLPLTERFNRTVRGFDPQGQLSIDAAVKANYAKAPIPQLPADQFRLNGGLTFAGVGNQPRSLWNANTANIAPRIGVAYQLDPRTAVRAGYGMFYDLDRQGVNQTGFSRRTSMSPTLDNGVTYIANTSNPFPSGYDLANGATVGLMTNVGQSVSFFNPNLRTPYIQRWQLGVQRELMRETMIEVSYVGNRGTRLRTGRAFDPVPRSYYSTSPTRDQSVIDLMSASVTNPFYPLLPSTSLSGTTVGRSQLLRPHPQFTGVSTTTNEGYSWYHSLQVRTERRFSAGFTVSVGWTWSKFMEATGFLNETDPRPERVISDQDRAQRIVASGVYELPFGKGKYWLNSAGRVPRLFVGGWQVQGIYQGQTGPALGFGDAIFTGNLKDIALPNGQRTVQRWFNIDAGFERSAAKQLSWDIRTLPSRFSGIRGDGLNNWDISLIKSTEITEKLHAQLRVEAVNAMNHAQFTAPVTTPTSTAFGTVTGLTTFPRTVQFGLRLMY